MKGEGALSRWGTFGPALFLMLALGLLPLANLVYTSFHTVTWSGGQATFDASSLPSGVYFYRLDATSMADPSSST